jgi:hypothetical protein
VVAVALGAAALHVHSLFATGQTLWRSDSRFYLYFTLRALGEDPTGAETQMRHLFDMLGFPTVVPLHQFPNYGGFRGRPLYPLLSTPFVALFGAPGLYVVPFAAYLAFALTLHAGLRRVARPAAATLPVVLVLVTGSAVYLVVPLAESLALALLAGWLCTLPWQGATSRRTLLVAAALVGAAGLTRQVPFFVVMPAVALAVRACWLPGPARRAWWQACGVAVAASAVAAAVSQRMSGSDLRELPGIATRKSDFHEALAAYPAYAWGQLTQEGHVLLRDVALMTLLGTALIGSVVLWRTVVPWLTAGALLGFLGTFALSPFATNLRLALPALPVLAVAAAVTLSRTGRPPETIVPPRDVPNSEELPA